jgi:hypothetical protein
MCGLETFGALCYILIIKANRMHYFSVLFGKQLYMFQTDLLSIIRSLNIVFTAISIFHSRYVACLLARSGWTSLADRQHNSMTNAYCCRYSIKTPDDGR